jgi:CheY-like chemotaxis protein
VSQNASILVAEDDAGHFALVRKNLWRTCTLADIVHFHTGEELLHFLFEPTPEQGIPAGRSFLILLDIRLPGKSGIEVLHQIKEDSHLQILPVFMLTTSSRSDDIDRSYEEGCCAYICKPRDYKDFMETVEFLGQLLSMPECKWPAFRRDIPVEIH